MDIPDADNVIMKMEPGTKKEGGGETLDKEVVRDTPDIKKECFEHSEKSDSAGKK